MREIRKSLETKIRDYALSKNIPIVFENVKKPPQNNTFLSTHLLPAMNVNSSLCSVKGSGIFQVMIHTLAEKGTKEAGVISDEIYDLFQSGTKTDNVFHNEPVSIDSGMMVDGMYCVAVSIPYIAFKSCSYKHYDNLNHLMQYNGQIKYNAQHKYGV